MQLVENLPIRITVPVPGDEVVFVCRRPSAKEISKFLTSRNRTHRNKVTSRLYEAREEFARSIILDVENVSFRTASGEVKPLNAQTTLSAEDKEHWSKVLDVKVESWLDLISISWFSSVAMFFEDTLPDDGAEGN